MFKSLLPLLLLVSSVEEVPNPRASNLWVSDTVDMIPASTEERMNAAIERLYQELKVEITVVTVDDVSTTPKEFATALFNHWGVGNATADNGLLILMVRDKRRLEMETGYGLEAVLPDSWLGSMQLSEMVPHFKRGDFGVGLEAGLTEVDERLRRNAAGLPLVSDSGESLYGDSARRESPGQKIWTLFLVFAGAALVYALVSWVKRSNRKCKACQIQMALLPESEEDQHLNPSQQHEERLGSVLYDVYCCPRCQATKVFDSNQWFTGYSSCLKCGTKAASNSTRTIAEATYSSDGSVEIISSCSHCHYSYSYTKIIPQLTHSSSSGSSSWGSSSSSSWGSSSSSSSSWGSSSSSSGSSSFGGGSSGGGGAGSSW